MNSNILSKLLFGALVIFIFSNCGKDDFSPSGLTYKLAADVVTGCDNEGDNYNSIVDDGCITEPTLGLQICSSVEFTSETAGNVIVTVFGTTDRVPFSYTLDGEAITITATVDGEVETSSGTVTESSVVLSSQDPDDNCQYNSTYTR